MSKLNIITVHSAIALATTSKEPLVFTNSDTGQVYRSRQAPGCLLFDMPGRQPLSQGQFLTANRYTAMTQSGEFIDDTGDDQNGDRYPDLDDAIDWANDPETSNDDLQAYLVDVAGEDNRDRKRETNVAKIAEFVSAQQ